MTPTQPIQLPSFQDLHILVIGDVMIDSYVSGTINRISPEAPVPVLEFSKVENRLGGAANVALNLCALGAQVTLISIVGNDSDADEMISLLRPLEGLRHQLIRLSDKKTTVKTRIMAGNQHILRIDREDSRDINSDEFEMVHSVFLDILGQGIQGIILQDYNKGLLSKTLIQSILTVAKTKDIPTFVDPKEKNFFDYGGCTVFKPNRKEMKQAVGTGDPILGAEKIRKSMDHEVTMITLGGEGLYIHTENRGDIYPTDQRVIADVCGAGDTVISVVCLCYLKGMTMSEIAKVANIAGGLVCEKPGVVSINLDELKHELL